MISIDQHADLLNQRFNDEVRMEHTDSLSLRPDGHSVDNETVPEIEE
jgi:hypothetical protein